MAADTTVEAGGTLHYFIRAMNVGDAETSGEFTLQIRLPEGMTSEGVTSETNFANDPYSCSGASGATEVVCTSSFMLSPSIYAATDLQVAVAGAAEGTLVSEVELSGGGASTRARSDATRIAASPPGFGLDSVDGSVDADANGTAFTRAAGHPYSASTSIAFDSLENPNPLIGQPWPAEPARDVAVELPAGFIGSPAAAAQCTAAQLAHAINALDVSPLCPIASQVGVVTLTFSSPGTVSQVEGPLPVFNMVPPPGAPARFGFNFAGTVVVLDARVRNGSDYGVTVDSRNISEGISLVGSDVTLWGVPADASHDALRSCPGEHAPSQGGVPCNADVTPRAFLRQPTSCAAPAGSPVQDALVTTIHTDSWFNPGARDAEGNPDLSDPAWKSDSFASHLPPGRPEAGPNTLPTDCAGVPFDPRISAQPTTNAADSPTGLDFHLTVPQACWRAEEQGANCQSDLRDARVTLPRGMTLNPAAASGLDACTPAQIGLLSGQGSPIRFTGAAASCPDGAKIGTVEIATPLLGRHDDEGNPVLDNAGNTVPEPLEGSVYLAKQSDNPFGSLLAMYLVAEGQGVVVKQAGEIEVGPGGRLTTVFADAPQTPFSDLHVSLFGGSRAALRTPPTCGSYAVNAVLTPWSGNAPVTVGSGFEIETGAGGGACGNPGFDPKLSAGTRNPLAGTTSPFDLRLTRADGEGELGGLSVQLPPGLSGYLTGIPYCPDSALAGVSGELGTGVGQENSPACPAASQVGTVTVGAGAGPNPFYTSSGRAYLAGPYKGAPLSLAVVAPAVAGPFDLGSVVVRNALRVDPETAQITNVSDPLPTILHGIPLDLRDVRVALSRDHFTLNPTSCDEMQIASTVTSAQGATASPSQRFQVGGCEKLGFKPKLSLRLRGKTKRSGNPALRATLTMPAGGANIAATSVALPHTEFLDQAHIRTVCTRVQYAAGVGGGSQCPAGSIYGHATAWSPLLDAPLSGPVYLRSSDNPLPDLVAALDGQIHIDLVGRIDSVRGGIRTTFATVPDAPVSKFTLSMRGGNRGLLENSRNICTTTNRATVQFDAQNGKTADLNPPLKAKCAKKKGKRK